MTNGRDFFWRGALSGLAVTCAAVSAVGQTVTVNYVELQIVEVHMDNRGFVNCEFNVSIQGPVSNTTVTMTTPGGLGPLPLQYDAGDNDFSFDDSGFSLSDFPDGTYLFKFNGGLPGGDQIPVDFVRRPPTGFVDILSPENGDVVSMSPLVQWQLPMGWAADWLRIEVSCDQGGFEELRAPDQVPYQAPVPLGPSQPCDIQIGLLNDDFPPHMDPHGFVYVTQYRHDVHARFYVEPSCVAFCSSNPNSTGAGAQLTCEGDPTQGLVLTSTPVPNTPGQFFFGPNMLAGMTNLGDGLRCVGGATVRILPFVQAGMMGQLPNEARLALSYTAPYAAGLTGTKHFQYWFRSGLATGTGSNTSDAISVTF